MTKKDLAKRFAKLAGFTYYKDKHNVNFFIDCFLESVRQGLVETGEIKLPGLFTIKMTVIPAGDKMIFNPSSGKYNTRQEHRTLSISYNGDCLLKSDFATKYSKDGEPHE